MLREENAHLAGLMEDNAELRERVYSVLARRPEVEDGYHATVATATGEDPPEDDEPERTAAGDQDVMRTTATDIITDDVNEINALDDEIAAHEWKTGSRRRNGSCHRCYRYWRRPP